MKHQPSLLLWVLLFSAQIVSGQVKQGFKLLEQKEFEKALAAFQKEENPDKGVAASYGMLKASAGIEKPQGWLTAITGYEKTLKSFEALEEKKQQNLNSEYQITKGNLDQAYNALFNKALTYIEKTPKTEAYRDSMVAIVSIVPQAYRGRFNKLFVSQKTAPAIKREKMQPGARSTQKAILVDRKPPEGSRLEFIKGFNSDGSEYIPVLSADGKMLYFVGSGRTDNYIGEDIFYTERLADGSWSEPKMDEFFSGMINEAVVSISADGNNMVLFIGGKPHLSTRTLEGWSEPLPIVLPKAYTWIGMASITRNGEALIFEAKENVHSDINIFVAFRKKDRDWDIPFNIGSTINTIYDDRTPFLHSDFKTLYFSSAGHGGEGGLDVFKSTRLDDTWKNWSTPENLGPAVNTSTDEYGFCIPPAGNVAYLASRIKGFLDMDIMRIPLDSAARPEAQVVITGKLTDGSGNSVKGQITVEDAQTLIELQKVNTSPDGSYAFSVDKTSKINYYATGENLVSTKKTFVDASLYKSDVAEEKVDIVTVKEIEKEGKALELRDLLFDFGKSELRPESKTSLQRIYSEIKGFNWAIEIGGHSDNVGSEQSNLKLSAQRAQAVSDYLIELGYPSAKISFKGYGPNMPIAGNDSDAGRAKNRRVEIKVKQ